MASTEPAEGLRVGMWPPSLSPSCSQMSLTSPKLQVLSPASLSGLNQASRKKEGKWVQGKKGVGGRMQDRTLYKRDGERERSTARENTLDHLIKQNRVVLPPRWALASIYLLPSAKKWEYKGGWAAEGELVKMYERQESLRFNKKKGGGYPTTFHYS